MSVQFVLQLGDIKGETIVKDAGGKTIEGGIDCLSWSWGMVQKGSAKYATGGGLGAADVDNLVIVKRVDIATPNIIKASLLGTAIKGGPIALRCFKVGGGDDPANPKKVEYVNIKLAGVVQVAKVITGQLEMIKGEQTDALIETVELHFSQVEFTYQAQKENNDPGDSFPTGPISIGT